MLSIAQVIVPFSSFPPSVILSLSNVVFAGTVSFTFIFLASALPVLLTLIVYVILLASFTIATLLSFPKSGVTTDVLLNVTIGFLVSGISVSPSIFAPFTNVPIAASNTSTVTVNTRVFPGITSIFSHTTFDSVGIYVDFSPFWVF